MNLVSLRRRVVAAGRPAGSSPGEKMGEFEGEGSLVFRADAAVFSVLDDYTTICEFFADAVGRGEIAFFLGVIAFRDQPIDLCIVRSALGAAVSESAKLFGIVVFQDGENSVESSQKLLHGGDVALAEFAFFAGAFRVTEPVDTCP